MNRTHRARTSKKLLVVAAVGIAAFSGIYGLAASLGLTTDTLGSGTAVVAACQPTTSPLNVTYGAATFSAGSYGLTTVTVTGLTNTCLNKAYKITVQGTGGTSLGEATGTTPTTSGTTSFSATLPSSVSAASVTGVSMVISG